MFARFVAVIPLALPLLAAATATGGCPDKHTLKCCNSAKDASEGLVPGLLDLLGLGDVTGLVGLGCGGLELLSTTKKTEKGCTGQALCCSSTNDDLIEIAVGCISVDV